MPFLALDIGNSSVKAALWDGAWSETMRFPTDTASAEAWAERLAPFAGATRAGLASVVPAATEPVAEAARTVTGAEATRVSAGLALPFRMGYRTPATLGADRLAAAVAGHALADGRAVVVLDVGTAITTDAVSAGSGGEAVYLGGAILPGPDLLRRALVRDTGQLPDVPWVLPPSPIGTSTAEAIQAGLTTLVLGGVTRLLRQTVRTLGGDAWVVATGGGAPWLAEHLEGIDRLEPTLVLDGIRLLADH